MDLFQLLLMLEVSSSSSTQAELLQTARTMDSIMESQLLDMKHREVKNTSSSRTHGEADGETKDTSS